MPCTTILVGKKASYDGSTMIARNDDGFFDVKKLIVVDKMPKKYKSVLSHVEIELPDNALSYTACPNVDASDGIWAACGINSANVAMTATETITSNPRVLGLDPYVCYKKKKKNEKEVVGGIGEEDFVSIVLPYIKSAREGVLRLGMLLEKYGTYEANGIAFSDVNEIWWLETIGGHNWIARRIKDSEYVIMPNQFGMDQFNFDDAYSSKKDYMCSSTLRALVKDNFLDLNLDGKFNPRLAFGSHSDSDHIYNTPRAWYMARYFNPRTYKWDGENADFTPESDDIPFSLVPEHKITVEDVKYILSSYYQGTKYNPYSSANYEEKGMYRSIGINRTGCMSILQLRDYVPKEIQAIEWICFGSNSFNTVIPLYTNTHKMPKYVSETGMIVDTNTFYWSSRLIGSLADPNYPTSIVFVVSYQIRCMNEGHRIINEYDKKMIETKDYSLIEKANSEVCNMVKKNTEEVLAKVLHDASVHMKNGYNRADN